MDEYAITCYHEAGHATAALAHGGRLRAISVRDEAVTRWAGSRSIRALVTLGGPWAEAMYLHTMAPAIASFTDQLDTALWRNQRDMRQCGHYPATPWVRWHAELLRPLWPLVIDVAGLLMDGAGVDAITAAVTAGLVEPDRKGA